MHLNNIHHNFTLTSGRPVSAQFKQRGRYDFNGACAYIRALPYGRNPDKLNLLSVFTDQRGTCSTKHALLYELALENGQHYKLVLGIFNMDAAYSTNVGAVLKQHNLDYIPEAHMYLRAADGIVDCTGTVSQPGNFLNELLLEHELLPHQITDYKVSLHRNFIAGWISHKKINYNLDELWKIREACILALSQE